MDAIAAAMEQIEAATFPHLEALGPRERQKRMAIVNSIIGTAQAIARPFKTPIPNAYLLRKRPFPNRTMPARKRRQLKKEAKARQLMQFASAALSLQMGQAEVYKHMATPIPFYGAGTPDAGIAMVQEREPEIIQWRK